MFLCSHVKGSTSLRTIRKWTIPNARFLPSNSKILSGRASSCSYSGGLNNFSIIHSQTHLSASEHYLPILNTFLSNFGCHCLFSEISMLFRTPTFDFRQYFKSFRHFCLSLDVIICVWTPLSHFVHFFQFLGSFVCFLTLKFVWFFFQPLLPNFSVQRT